MVLELRELHGFRKFDNLGSISECYELLYVSGDECILDDIDGILRTVGIAMMSERQLWCADTTLSLAVQIAAEETGASKQEILQKNSGLACL